MLPHNSARPESGLGAGNTRHGSVRSAAVATPGGWMAMNGLTSDNVTSRPECASCSGTGELGTDVGLVDCPDCGGSGHLPHPSVLVEWRARDIERANLGDSENASDVRWLVTELRTARRALTEIMALAQDAETPEAFTQIRLRAGEALSLFTVQPVAEA
jgi:hypothetical protein